MSNLEDCVLLEWTDLLARRMRGVRRCNKLGTISGTRSHQIGQKFVHIRENTTGIDCHRLIRLQVPPWPLSLLDPVKDHYFENCPAYNSLYFDQLRRLA